MNAPETPREMLEHLTMECFGDVYISDVQAIIREFNRLAGLDRTKADLRANAYDAALFLRNMGEVEL